MSIPTIRYCYCFLSFFLSFCSMDANERNWHTKMGKKAPVTIVVNCANISLCVVNFPFCMYSLFHHKCDTQVTNYSISHVNVCHAPFVSLRCWVTAHSLIKASNPFSISFQLQISLCTFILSIFMCIRFGYSKQYFDFDMVKRFHRIWKDKYVELGSGRAGDRLHGRMCNICKRDWLNKLPKKWTGIMNCLNVRALTCWSVPIPRIQTMCLHLLSFQLPIDLLLTRSLVLSISAIVRALKSIFTCIQQTNTAQLSPFPLNWTKFETWLTLAVFCVTKQTIRE